MSESGDFNPGPWAGHDFSAAYEHYDAHTGRSYTKAVRESRPRADVLEASISTDCTNPLVFWCDDTGSMGDWPKVIFSKLPYLELEAKEYLGDDLEIAFGAIGDGYGDEPDRYPIQMRPFTSGTDLKTRMEELVIQGGGGRGLEENYELALLYSLHNISMPKALRPILIMIGDEKPYEFISVESAESMAHVTLKKRRSVKDVIKQLQQKFAVYLIRKPYGSSGGGNTRSSTDDEVRRCWVDLLGEDHVCDLPEPGRVVDVTFGILAKETGRIPYFREELEGRQRPDQVATVYKSLASIHKLAGPRTGRSGASILKIEHKGDKGGPSRRLLE